MGIHIPGFEPWDPRVPSKNKKQPTQAQMLRVMATLEHSNQLEKVKKDFLDKAHQAAMNHELSCVVFATGWTQRIQTDFINWLSKEGFKYEIGNYRNETDIKVSW